MAKAKKGKKYTKKDNTERMSFSTAAVAAIIVSAAVFLELSNFHIFGVVGNALKYVQFGLFGWMGYIFPILVIACTLYLSISKAKDKLSVIFACAFFLALCTLIHLTSKISLTAQIITYFKNGAAESSGGGIIGGSIAAFFNLAFSRAGAYVLTIALLLFSFFMIFRKTIIGIIKEIIEENTENTDDEYQHVQGFRGQKSKDELHAHIKDSDIYDGQGNEENGRVRRIKKRERTVYETTDGTRVVRIVNESSRLKKSKNRKRADLKRINKKASPMRDGTFETERSDNVVKGVSSDTAVGILDIAADDMHEITEKKKGKSGHIDKLNGSRSSSDSELVSEDAFADDRIKTDGINDSDIIDSIAQADKDISSPNGTDIGEDIEELGTDCPFENISDENESKVSGNTKGVASPGHRATLSGTTFSHGEPARTFKPVHSIKGVVQDSFVLPPVSLLARPQYDSASTGEDASRLGAKLIKVLETFGVVATLTDTQVGPSVTRFELRPELGTRVSKITSLSDDLKLNLAVPEIRIEAPIPGKAAIGIEVPNKNRRTVVLRELLESDTIKKQTSKIAFSAGKDISGNVIAADLAKMPHMLVAGTTGSGKSVFLNSILMCILYRAKPSEVGLIIIDPKKVEFGVYQGIPHLMKQVVTDPGQAVSTLRWAVGEMTNRYQRMQMSGVRDFKSYNQKLESGRISSEETDPKRMHQIVIVIDELADLMMVAAKEVESLICRLAQLARAAGIHLIIATQRPSVDVVTGLIKANIPARVALLVASGVDSRTIIDMSGAEKLMGNGDMLFYPTGYVKPIRVQGAFVSDDEIWKTVEYLKEQKEINQIRYYEKEEAEMEQCVAEGISGASAADDSSKDEDSQSRFDEYLYEAGKLCIESGKASSSMLQRRFSIGFNRAARIIDQLYEIGAIGAQNGAKPREILVDEIGFEQLCRSEGLIE